MARLRHILAVIAFAMLAPVPGMAAPARDTISLTRGWHFHLGDAPDAAIEARFDDASWDRVSLPHNWNRMGGTATRGPDYLAHHGQGWYRLSFETPSALGDRLAWLQFDAASTVVDVWLNGVHLGAHKGAFAAFRFDATATLNRSGPNVLVVKADNSDPQTPGSPTAEVIPMGADFPMYGGLYRPVSLVLTAPAHIAMTDFGGPGIYATVQSVDAERAQVALLARLENMGAAPRALRIVATVTDDQGRVVAEVAGAQTLPASGKGEWRQAVAIPRPRLWNGLADPYLYRLRVELRDAESGVVDAVDQPLGLRTVRMDPDKGFFLNGRSLPLHGVSRHQDRPIKGWAIDDADIDEDYALLKDIGANTVRLAHYQHAERAYQNADRDGLAVWAEIPLVDRSAPWGLNHTTPGLAANAEQQLREMIRQNYNHPSVVVWSIANEVNNEATRGHGPSHAVPLLQRLRQVVHEEDPSRPATLADSYGTIGPDIRPGVDTVAGLTDVIGYNRYFGWYNHKVSDLGAELDTLHALYPKQPMSVGEYGAGGALSQHTDDPDGGPVAIFGRPHPEEAQSELLERSWEQIKVRPYLWASWVWNMFDFSNEIRLEGDLTDTNDKGLVTFDRKTKKDAYYFFKANWSSEPFVHLVGRRYVDRPYPVVQVKAYSNLARVRLSVNGRDLGPAPCVGGVCRWNNVSLNTGDNRIVAEGAAQGGPLGDAVAWRLHGAPGLFHIRAGSLSGARAADGVLWGSDVFMTGGEGHFRDAPPVGRGAPSATPRPVSGAEDQTPYEHWRSGRFAYAVPTPNGHYRITLHMFEPEPEAKPGARVFDIAVQGRTVAPGIDIVAQAGGTMRALQIKVDAVVDDGVLRIAFVPRQGEALLSGLVIEPATRVARPTGQGRP